MVVAGTLSGVAEVNGGCCAVGEDCCSSIEKGLMSLGGGWL